MSPRNLLGINITATHNSLPDLKFWARVTENFVYRQLAATEHTIKEIVVVLILNTLEYTSTFRVKAFSLEWRHLVPVRIQ